MLIYLGLVLVSIIWGANFGVLRWVMDSLDPGLAIFLRYGMALPFLFLILKIKEGNVGIKWRDAGTLLIVGFLGVTLLEFALMYSIKLTTLANTSLLSVAPWPIFTALFAPLFTKETVTAKLMAGGGLAMVGVIMIILGGGERLDLSSQYMAGNLLAVGISIMGAFVNLACMSLMNRYSPLRVTSWYILFGVVLLFPFTLGSWGKVHWNSLDFTFWGAMLFNVLPATLLAFILWNYCMKYAGATKANFFRYVVPAAAVVTGYIMFRETITIMQVVGGMIIAGGLVWISLEKPKEDGLLSVVGLKNSYDGASGK